MRNLIVIAMLLVGASMAGWFKIRRDGDRTTIEINKDEIRQDTRGVIDRGREMLHQQELQSGAQSPLSDRAFSMWNQQPGSQAVQSLGGTAQAGYQDSGDNQMQGAYQSPAAPRNAGRWGQPGAPASHWQQQASPGTPYQQPYAR